jgi:hypothetical protein
MNDKVEDELVEFKKEIEEKFEASSINIKYRFKRTLICSQPNNDCSSVNALQPSSTFGQTEDKKKHRKVRLIFILLFYFSLPRILAFS